jgi:phosphatidylserine synthase
MLITETGLVTLLALAIAASFVCGMRPFAVALCLGLAGSLGALELPSGLAVLQSAMALVVCAVLAMAERLADTRALEGHEEDLLLSGLRVPLGAVVMAAWLVDAFGAWGWLGLPLGAALAAAGQALKAALRAMGGLLGWRRTLAAVLLSIDLLVPASLVLAWNSPLFTLAVLAVTLLVALPAAVWWVRELRSRWRRWAAMSVGPLV